MVRILFLAVGVVLALSSTSQADDVGPVGNVVSLEVYGTSADTYLARHGRIRVRSSADGSIAEYSWGGAACGTKVLTEAQVDALYRAFENKKTLVQPLSLPGQGLNLCLVGTQFVQKKYLSLLAP